MPASLSASAIASPCAPLWGLPSFILTWRGTGASSASSSGAAQEELRLPQDHDGPPRTPPPFDVLVRLGDGRQREPHADLEARPAGLQGGVQLACRGGLRL